MLSTLLLIPLTMLISALHGWDGFSPKWPLKAAHVISTALIGYLGGLPILYAVGCGTVLPLLFWGLMRRGKQADAELKAMEYPADWRLGDVAKSHIPHLLATLALVISMGVATSWVYMWVPVCASFAAFTIPLFALMRYNYGTERGNKLKNNGKFIDCRRMTEIAVGLSAGIQHAAILATAVVIW